MSTNPFVRHACIAALAMSNMLSAASAADDAPADGATTRVRMEPGCKRPTYPAEALRNGDTGEVGLQVSVAASGEVTGTQVLKSSGHPALDQATAEAIARCKFVPATRNGVAVDCTYRVRYAWTIEQQTQAKAASLERSGHLRQDAQTGSNIRRSSVRSVLPPEKRYAELTPEQQAYVRSLYESMPAGDEPPYPLNGMAPILQAIVDAQQVLRVEGPLSLEVRIDRQGEATAVDILKAPSPEMAKAAGSIAMLTRYKPAVCGGKPCAMAFPIRLEMTLQR
ncbi:TonB family protein [Oxalobacteraceae bacterium OM1]|nr:TonB family protein [Oxalobacteraceae bacterium OM1]